MKEHATGYMELAREALRAVPELDPGSVTSLRRANSALNVAESLETSKPGLEGTAPAASAAGAALPCLSGNSSTEIEERPQANHVKAARALGENCIAFVKRFGLEQVAFVTVTLPKRVAEHKEAQRRFNSMRTHVLRPRYGNYIKVSERHASGGWHFHLLVPVGVDIRTGFDFAAHKEASKAKSVALREYWTKVYGKSACPKLREEWTFWRKNALKFGFGRVEFVPIRTNEEGIGRYMGGYIGKHLKARKPEDKGVHLVAYSKGARSWATRHTHYLSLTRFKLRKLARMIGAQSVTELCEGIGPRWGYKVMPILDLVWLNPDDLPSIAHMDMWARVVNKRTEQHQWIVWGEAANRLARQMAFDLVKPRSALGRRMRSSILGPKAWSPSELGPWPCVSSMERSGAD